MGSGASAATVPESDDCKFSIDQVKNMFGSQFDENLFNADVNSDGHVKYSQLIPYVSHVAVNLNFDAVKTLWFTAAQSGRGRSLADLKDTVNACSILFYHLFGRFTSCTGEGMTLPEFRKFVSDAGCNLDADTIDPHFYECTSFPNDEDDEEEVSKILAGFGSFVSAIVRIANAWVIQENGNSDSGLREQLVSWLTACAENLGVSAAMLQQGVDASMLRDPSFFEPPASFSASECHIFMDFAVGEEALGRVVCKLNTEITPKTAYNFMCLCTGEKGMGEVTGVKLHYKGSSFHRVLNGVCVQAGDLQDAAGYGGESVYSGEFSDENFSLLHDAEGVLSMANTGPDTNTSQFFITLAAAPSLDQDNCAFGRVVSGMEVVTRLGNVECDEEDKPTKKCVIVDCGVVVA